MTQVKADLKEGDKFKVTDVAKKLGDMWKEMSDDDKVWW